MTTSNFEMLQEGFVKFLLALFLAIVILAVGGGFMYLLGWVIDELVTGLANAIEHVQRVCVTEANMTSCHLKL